MMMLSLPTPRREMISETQTDSASTSKVLISG